MIGVRVLVQVTAVWGCVSGVNLYLTPSGGGRALPLHNDDQDVVLLQVAGKSITCKSAAAQQ